MKPGSHNAMKGKAITNAKDAKSQKINGRAALYISPIVVSGGAAPFITNRLKPKGGDVVAVSMMIR